MRCGRRATRVSVRVAVAVVVAVSLVACGSQEEGPSPELVAACGEPASDASYDPVAGRGALPLARLPTLADPDAVVCTTSWEGTPTVINFWATWCEPCTEEMPALQSASETLGDDIRFVGIRQWPGDRQEALTFLADTGVEYEQVDTLDQEYFIELGNRGMPTTLFVEPDGTVVGRHTGQLSEQEVLDLVAEHLGVEP